MGRVCQLWETREILTGFWWGILRERDRVEDIGVEDWIILKIYSRSGLRRHGLD
jgi:hypothetical protein